MAWKYAHIGFEGDGAKIGGVSVWKSEWRGLGQSVDLPHPSYPNQIHSYHVYDLGEGSVVQFAAAELSYGVWGFYVPA